MKNNDLILVNNGNGGLASMTQLLTQTHGGMGLDDDKDDKGRRKYLKKKHYPLNLLV